MDTTQLMAKGVALLTGSGVIAPTDPPLSGSAEFSELPGLLAADHNIFAPDGLLGGFDLSWLDGSELLS
ncbi:phosphodiesterase, partial [Mycolicibacter kumamotonensis]|nr:phosphodiesterase [Mycolicibacter kumamotonensis]